MFENKKEGLPANSIVELPGDITNLKKKKERKIYLYKNTRLQRLARKWFREAREREKLLEKKDISL